MLATLAEPFDSDRHEFEIKWDGYRALLHRDRAGTRLWSRNRNDLSAQFSELDTLREFPPGLILDGEIVIFKDGKPDFSSLQRRARSKGKGQSVYIVFDLLYQGFESLMDRTLQERRELLRELLTTHCPARVQYSEGIVGGGLAMYEKATSEGLEGITAKRIDSRYLPGRRSEDWLKIKNRQQLHCVVAGFMLNQHKRLKSLALASDVHGDLRYVGQAASGLSTEDLAKLEAALLANQSVSPLVELPKQVVAVKPTIFCTVSFVEFTPDGHLRAPVCESYELA